MKKIALIIVIVTTSVCINAQKIKLKKDQVLLDKVPIATFEGKASAFVGTDITFMSLDGEKIFTFKTGLQKYFSPTNKSVVYNQITTYNPDKTIRYISKVFLSKKKIAEMMFVNQDPAVIEDGAIVVDAMENLLNKLDESEKLKEDSIRISKYENELAGLLKSNKVDRDLGKPVLFKYIDKKTHMTTTRTTYKIVQDKTLIGYVEQISTPGTGASSAVLDFVVYKYTSQFNTLDGKKTNELLTAYLKVSSFPKMWIMQDKKVMDTKINEKALFVDFLVKQGYL